MSLSFYPLVGVTSTHRPSGDTFIFFCLPLMLLERTCNTDWLSDSLTIQKICFQGSCSNQHKSDLVKSHSNMTRLLHRTIVDYGR
jgi:hypothetical protein